MPWLSCLPKLIDSEIKADLVRWIRSRKCTLPYCYISWSKNPQKTDWVLSSCAYSLQNRFCHYFINYRRKVEACVRNAKYRPLPVPSGGLEISILLVVKKTVLQKMENSTKYPLKKTFKKMTGLKTCLFQALNKRV